MTRLTVIAALISALVTAGTASAQQAASIDRCLSGQVQKSSCVTMLNNFWEHNPDLDRAARRHGIEPSLVKAVAAVESRFKAGAVSPKGATGLMQIMPATGRDMGLQPADLPKASVSAHGGAQYLRQMYDQFQSWELAIAAYNAGPGAVERYGRKVPPFKETQAYVVDVLDLYRRFKESERLHTPNQPPAALLATAASASSAASSATRSIFPQPPSAPAPVVRTLSTAGDVAVAAPAQPEQAPVRRITSVINEAADTRVTASGAAGRKGELMPPDDSINAPRSSRLVVAANSPSRLSAAEFDEDESDVSQ